MGKTDKITVWTRQNKKILVDLKEKGRYIAKKHYIKADMGDISSVVFVAYDWLVKHSPKAYLRPEDVEYLVWVSYEKEAVMLTDDNTVVLELSIDPEIITPININKWGAILNYSYIPENEADAVQHQQLLKAYGISDVQACMTQFYPQIKKKIMNSWERLFDPNVQLLKGKTEYGTIWEVKKEWVQRVIR